jgi:hypothetical protein
LLTPLRFGSKYSRTAWWKLDGSCFWLFQVNVEEIHIGGSFPAPGEQSEHRFDWRWMYPYFEFGARNKCPIVLANVKGELTTLSPTMTVFVHRT